MFIKLSLSLKTGQDAQVIKQKGKHKTRRQQAFTRTSYVRHRKGIFA